MHADRNKWSQRVCVSSRAWCLCSMMVFCGLFAATAAGQRARPAAESRSAAAGSGVTGDRAVVAQVNDQPIYKGQVDQALASLTKGQQVPASQQAQTQAAVLEQLIKSRLLSDFIGRNESLQPSAEEINKQLDDISSQLKSLQKTTLDRFVRQKGMTMAGFKNQLANEMSKQKFLQQYGTEERIEAYFQRNARHFDGTQLRVSHILLRPKGNGAAADTLALQKRAEQIKADIEAGKMTFAEAALQFSAGPSRQDGGDLGFIGRKGPMVGEFNQAAFDLEQGKISEPVITSFGVHLITVTEVKPGEKSLELVRDEVMPSFTQWLVDELVESEMKTAKIEFNDNFPHFKPGTRELAGAEK